MVWQHVRTDRQVGCFSKVCRIRPSIRTDRMWGEETKDDFVAAPDALFEQRIESEPRLPGIVGRVQARFDLISNPVRGKWIMKSPTRSLRVEMASSSWPANSSLPTIGSCA
jgi:hypothetical protein